MRHTLIDSRIKLGYTVSQLAEKLEISERFYRYIEHGTREGKGYIWDALETIFNIPQRQLRENSTQEYCNRD